MDQAPKPSRLLSNGPSTRPQMPRSLRYFRLATWSTEILDVTGSIGPIAFETVNLDSITAVVIGGTSLFGGRGSIVGSVLGALIVGVFSTGLSLAGVDSIWQYLATGNLIIFAVAIDQWLRRASQ